MHTTIRQQNVIVVFTCVLRKRMRTVEMLGSLRVLMSVVQGMRLWLHGLRTSASCLWSCGARRQRLHVALPGWREGPEQVAAQELERQRVWGRPQRQAAPKVHGLRRTSL